MWVARAPRACRAVLVTSYRLLYGCYGGGIELTVRTTAIRVPGLALPLAARVDELMLKGRMICTAVGM